MAESAAEAAGSVSITVRTEVTDFVYSVNVPSFRDFPPLHIPKEWRTASVTAGGESSETPNRRTSLRQE